MKLIVFTYLVGFVSLAFGVNAQTSTSVLIGLLSLAAFLDFRSHQIPNWLNYSGIVFAVTYNILMPLWGDTVPAHQISFYSSIAGGMTCGAFMLMLWNMKFVGGGDVKLVCIIGLMLGVTNGITALLLTHLLAAAYIIARKLADAVIEHEFIRATFKPIQNSLPMAGFYFAGTAITIVVNQI